ncbi:hypothetical protein [Caldisphaera sp.]|uniref:hypothetical protein n=1 Tax=Caldisphaera sp. TaxID=2060322 RepID=UPI0025BBBAFE|nr:hypothetical protein [Caldisphaera sp.]
MLKTLNTGIKLIFAPLMLGLIIIILERLVVRPKKDEWCFIVGPHLGDIFIGLGILRVYKKKMQIKRICILVDKKYYFIAKSLNVDDKIIRMPHIPEVLYPMMNAYRVRRPGIISTPPDFNFPFINREEVGKELKRSLVLVEKYKVLRLFKDLNLHIGKTVILFPFYSGGKYLSLNESFWNDLINKISDLGYDVVVNSNAMEFGNKNCLVYNIPLDLMQKFVEYAGVAISIRSGICDFIIPAKALKIVLYYDKDQMLYWSFKNYGISDFKEINLSKSTEDDIIKEILKMIKINKKPDKLKIRQAI